MPDWAKNGFDKGIDKVKTLGKGAKAAVAVEDVESVGKTVKAAETVKGVADAGKVTEVTETVDDIVSAGEKALEGGTGTEELILKGTTYTEEYANKLKNTYKIFKENGYEVSEHGLNRILVRINQGKIESIDAVIEAMNTGTKYIDTVNGGTVIYKNGISIHISEDGFVKTVIGNAKIKSTWEVID